MGRPKGNSAEREVAKLIKAWWAELEPNADFVRTPLSGGWGGPSLRANFKASGDLMTTAERFPFTVEVKRREAWVLDRLLEGQTSPVWGWWKQAQTQGLEMNAIPMLWIRRNREPWRVLIPWDVAKTHVLQEARRRSMRELLDIHEWEPWQLAKIDYGNIEPTMILAESFLSIHPLTFATILQRGKARSGGAR